MIAIMNPILMTHENPNRYASPGYPISVLPLYWVAYNVSKSTGPPSCRPAR